MDKYQNGDYDTPNLKQADKTSFWNPLKSYRYSPSKINIALGWLSLIISTIFLYMHLCQTSLKELIQEWLNLILSFNIVWVCPLIFVVVVGAIAHFSFTSKSIHINYLLYNTSILMQGQEMQAPKPTNNNDLMIYANDFTNELIQFFVKLSGFEIHISSLFIMGFSRLMHEIETKDPKQWARIENIINQIITAQNNNKAVEIHETITTKLSIPLQRILATCNMKRYIRHKQEAEETALRILAFLGGTNYTGENEQTAIIMPMLSQGIYDKQSEVFTLYINPLFLAKLHRESKNKSIIILCLFVTFMRYLCNL